MPVSIQHDIEKYEKKADKWRVLGGKLLLQKALKKTNKHWMIEQLMFTEKGKPHFAKGSLNFNISHSGDLVVLVINDGPECGIDVEMHRPIDYAKFTKKFTDKEWEQIESADDSQRQFFHFWSVKESVIKADGRGIEVLGKTEIITEHEAICDATLWQIQPFELADGYSSCVASSQTIGQIVPERVFK